MDCVIFVYLLNVVTYLLQVGFLMYHLEHKEKRFVNT